MRNSKLSQLSLAAGVLAAVSVTSACTEDVDSKDIRTSGMYPEFSAVTDGENGTVIRARIKVGGNDSNTYVDVGDEDSLIGTVGEEEKTLGEVSDERYGADFEEDEGGTSVNIALDRGEEDDGAPESTVELPEPFELTLLSGNTIRRGDPIKFSWSNEDEPGTMNWELEGDCFFDEDDSDIGDTGEFTIGGEEHEQLGSDDDEDSCTATLTVDRVVDGTVDDAYGDGEFEAIQRRVLTFTSVGPDAEITDDEPDVEEVDAGADEPDDTEDVDAGDVVEAEPDAGDETTTESDAGASDADAG